MVEIRDYEAVDASNTATPPGGAPEGMDYRDVNDTLRAFMGAVKRHKLDNDGSLLDTGTGANAVVVTPNGTYGSLQLGDTFVFRKNGLANTGNMTFNGVALRNADGTELPAGIVVAGQVCSIMYSDNPVGWRMTSQLYQFSETTLTLSELIVSDRLRIPATQAALGPASFPDRGGSAATFGELKFFYSGESSTLAPILFTWDPRTDSWRDVDLNGANVNVDYSS